jgi:hypothetical protein
MKENPIQLEYLKSVLLAQLMKYFTTKKTM